MLKIPDIYYILFGLQPHGYGTEMKRREYCHKIVTKIRFFMMANATKYANRIWERPVEVFGLT